MLQGVVTEVTDAKNREMLFEANEDFIIKVQALARGYMARKQYRERMSYLKGQEPAVVKIQVRTKIYVYLENLSNIWSKKVESSNVNLSDQNMTL